MESFGDPVKRQIRRGDDVRRQGDYKGEKGKSKGKGKGLSSIENDQNDDLMNLGGALGCMCADVEVCTSLVVYVQLCVHACMYV